MLKILMLRKQKDLLLKELKELGNPLEEISKREETVVQAIDDVETDEEMEVVEEEIQEIEKEKEELEEKKKSLEEQLEEINKEIEELENKEPESKEDRSKVAGSNDRKNIKTRGSVSNMRINKFETREQMIDRLNQPEVREFYGDLRGALERRTELKGKELLIPEQVMWSINQRVGDYGTVINLVDRFEIKGTTRVVINAGTPTLVWTEMCDKLEETVLGSIDKVELDGYKLGAYAFICNAIIEDSEIDFANFIEQEFAKAIAEGGDQAIINGKGAEEKQPEGITTKIKDVKEVKDLLDVLTLIGNLDDGKHNGISGTPTLVTNRNTYYKYFLPETLGKDSNGKIVYGLGQTLPDGTKIELSQAVADGEFIAGDWFNGYKFGVRKGMFFDMNENVRWIEEQTGFKVSGRADGKVVKESLFVRGKFVDKVEVPEA